MSVIFAILIADSLTLEENAVIGSFLTAVADNIFLISAQRTLIKSAIEEQEAMQDYEEEKKKYERSKEIQKLEAEERQIIRDNLTQLNQKMTDIETLLKKHIPL